MQPSTPPRLFAKSRQMLEVGASSRYTRERERRTRLEDRAGLTYSPAGKRETEAAYLPASEGKASLRTYLAAPLRTPAP